MRLRKENLQLKSCIENGQFCADTNRVVTEQDEQVVASQFLVEVVQLFGFKTVVFGSQLAHLGS